MRENQNVPLLVHVSLRQAKEMRKVKFSLSALLGTITLFCVSAFFLSKFWAEELEGWQTYSAEKFKRAISRRENVIVFADNTSPPHTTRVPVFCAIDTVGIEEFAKTNSFALFEIDFANCDISENRFFRESKIGKPYPFLPIVIIYRCLLYTSPSPRD